MNPATTWGPLIVIFGVTAVKELVDDLGRAAEDRVANSRSYEVVRSGELLTVRAPARRPRRHGAWPM